MTIYVLMGVSGCGKSTVGRAASEALGLPFVDADDLHSPRAIAKMSAGRALSSRDRRPWGRAIANHLKDLQSETGKADILLACSALEMNFRKRLRAAFSGDVVYLHLHGDLITLKRRLDARKDHFFKPDMLASQFKALEMPKRAHNLDIALPVSAQVEQIKAIITGAPG